MNVAVAGLGFMGVTHLRAWRQVTGAHVTAIVSSSAKKLAGDLSGTGGNLEPAASEPIDFSGFAQHTSLASVLADPKIDIVDLCIPTDRHAPEAIAALEAGKHVLIEKPMALTVAEASAMRQAADRAGRILMAGHVLRFIPAWQALADALKHSGPVRSALFRRKCAAPAWSQWLTDKNRSGGGIFDLLIHDADFCISVWGMPASVTAQGHEDLARGIDVVHAVLNYPGCGPVVISGGWHHPESYPFSMEFTVTTDESTLEWAYGQTTFRRHSGDGKMTPLELPVADPFAAELQYFTDCAIHGRQPELCPPSQSSQAVALMANIIESRQLKGKTVSCGN